MKAIVAKSLLNSHSYSEYREIVSKLLAEGKATGNVQSEDLVHYSLLNETRMNRLEKTIALDPMVLEQLKNLPKKYVWLVISEGWCGDAAQLLPIFNKMASVSENIDLRIVFRDANEELMEHFLTNGGRSIPKLILIDATLDEVKADFGPRPKEAADLVRKYKEKHGHIDETLKTELQLWYLHDKGLSAQKEVVALF